MKTCGFAVSTLALVFVTGVASGYEDTLHQEMSKQAFSRLTPSHAKIFSSLGLAGNASYSGTDGTPRAVAGLVGFGALYEDDKVTKRSLNHFYNPQWEVGHQGLAWGSFPSSKQWIFEDRTGQDFSYADARAYHFQAVAAEYPVTRDQNAGLLFQSLGHIAHHIQDMAQPQHVRDDAHCHVGDSVLGTGFDGCREAEILLTSIATGVNGPVGGFVASQVRIHEPSVYEEQTVRELADQDPSNLLGILGADNRYGNLAYANALWGAKLVMGAPTDYWDNAKGTGNAQFTSLNFVSEETNFTITDNGNIAVGPTDLGVSSLLGALPYPNGGNAVVVAERIEDLAPNRGLAGNIYFVRSNVFDPLTGTTPTVARMSAFSVFNPELVKKGSKPFATLNEFTYRSHMSVLIPRAVALSKGFMDYFFRGSLEVVTDKKYWQNGEWYWRFKIVNRSAENMSGNFFMYYDNTSSRRRQIAAGVPGTLTLAPGGQSALFTVVMPADTNDVAGAVKTVLAFSGTLGQETGNVTTAITDVTLPAKPAIPCGSTLSAQGGPTGYPTAGQPTLHDLGNKPGPVTLEFEAFDIPDAIELRSESDTLLLRMPSVGLGAGRHVGTFNFDPAVVGSTKVKAKVVGNADPETWWTFTLACPNQVIDNTLRVVDRIGVTFSYGCTTATSCMTACQSNVFVDGQYMFSTGGNSGSALVELAVGRHVIEYRDASCSGGPSFGVGSYGMSYTDNAGTKKKLSDVHLSSSPQTFYVQ